MHILVTGATGFIGASVCRLCLQLGYEVTALVRPESEKTAALPRGVNIIHDYLGNVSVGLLRKGAPECCIHCAWITTPGMFWTSPDNFLLEQESITLFRTLVDSGISRIIALGSCAEYFPKTTAMEPPPYISCKRRTAQALFAFQQSAPSFDAIWCRIFYPYGPGENPQRFIPSMITSLLNRRQFTVKTGTTVKDYIHVSDIAAALVLLSRKGVTGTYDIGTGRGIQLRELAGIVAKLCQATEFLHILDQEDSLGEQIAAPSQLTQLGWQPHVRLEDGLAQMIEDLKLTKMEN